MALYGYVDLCRTMYGCVWLCKAMQGYKGLYCTIRLCMAI